MHDLLNNILTIISLVVHTIEQLFIRRRDHHDIAGHDTEKDFKTSQFNCEERKGEEDEKKSTIK